MATVETVFANNSASPETGATGVDKAAGEIDRMFPEINVPDEPKSEPKTRSRANDEPSETEDDEPSLKDDLDETSTSEEDEEGEDEGEEPEGEEPEDDDPEVDLDEKGSKVKMSELKAGYERQQDYTRKTQELAQERNVLYTYAGDMRKERDVLLNKAQEIYALANALMPDDTTWEHLKRTNPQGYIAAQEEWKNIEKKKDQILAATKDALQSEHNETQRQRNLFINEENAKLQKVLPAIFDKVKGPQIQERIFKYGEKHGFKREELQNAVDHREIVTLYKAMRYDEIRGQTPQIGKAASKPAPKPVQGGKVPQKSPPPRPGRPGNDRRTELGKAQANLRRSGSVEDAAMAFSAMMRK